MSTSRYVWLCLEALSSLKERAGVKGGFGLRFYCRWAFAGHDDMASRLLPLTAAVSCERGCGSRAGPWGPAACGGAEGVLDARAGAPIMGWPGGRPRTLGGVCGVVRAPFAGCAAWQARWLPSSLRVCPGLAGRGAWGGSRQVRAGSITTTSAPPRRSPGCRCGRGTDNEAAARPAGPAAHAAGLMARRTRPSRMA